MTYLQVSENQVCTMAQAKWRNTRSFYAASNKMARSILSLCAPLAEQESQCVGMTNFQGPLSDPRTLVAKQNAARRDSLRHISRHVPLTHDYYRLRYDVGRNVHVIDNRSSSETFEVHLVLPRLFEEGGLSQAEKLMLDTTEVLSRIDNHLHSIRGHIESLKKMGFPIHWDKSAAEWVFDPNSPLVIGYVTLDGKGRLINGTLY